MTGMERSLGCSRPLAIGELCLCEAECGRCLCEAECGRCKIASMLSALLPLPLRLRGVDAEGRFAVLFVRDDARDDSQEWYTEWREGTADCQEAARLFLAAAIRAWSSSGRRVVGCVAKASCFACVGTCLYGGAGGLTCSAAAVFLCSTAASLAFLNVVKRGIG
jgi:hypothetical protein